MSRRILGFDPGLANTGWGVLDADTSRLRLVDYGFISTDPEISQGERLNIIYSETERVVEKYAPGFAGVESLYFAKNVRSAIPVAEARGVLLLLLNRHGIVTNEYTPQQIKLSITGNGRADKNQVQQMIKIILGLRDIPRPDHAADAIGAAVCCFNNVIISERGVV